LEMAGVSWIIGPGWPWTTIFPILTSQVARITDMSHQHLAISQLFVCLLVQWVITSKVRRFISSIINSSQSKDPSY
jgi:hypothetical protein